MPEGQTIVATILVSMKDAQNCGLYNRQMSSKEWQKASNVVVLFNSVNYYYSGPVGLNLLLLNPNP